MKASLNEIADLVEGVLIGEGGLTISTLSPIDQVLPGSLIFAEGTEHLKKAECSDATAVLVHPNIENFGKPVIQVASPLKAFIQLLHHYYPQKKPVVAIHPTAAIAEDVQLGQDVSIGPYVVIESGSRIGDRCVLKSHVHIGYEVSLGEGTILHPHVTVYDHCKLGKNVSIHAGSIIGSDGFGYIQENGEHVKIPHIGRVIIEDEVEIGANTVIDRATMGETVVGQGTKIDNLVQVAHSVKLGKRNILCAFTGIAGSTTSGDYVIFAANVGVSDHVRIEDGVVLGARAGVPPRKHLKEGQIYLGSPARPKNKAIEVELSTARIPIMRKNLKNLTEKVTQLVSRIKQLEEQ